jgi:hypothetical protein
MSASEVYDYVGICLFMMMVVVVRVEGLRKSRG